MCIICRCGDDGNRALDAFALSRTAMQRAAVAMKICSATDPGYDATHKKMVKLMREWNRLEESRESGHSVAGQVGDRVP